MIVNGSVLVLPFDDIDTDQIIPAHHLTVLEPGKLGAYLFDGHPALSERLSTVHDARIVVTGANFGCGSSREHAAWALKERGFQAVIARSFSRIFLENAYNNGIVPVVLGDEALERCSLAEHLTIDVEKQFVRLADGTVYSFDLDPVRKNFVLGGGFLQFLASRIPAIREWETCRA